jgi:ferric-dicitrate binding protein FerR (iron transport regulator)
MKKRVKRFFTGKASGEDIEKVFDWFFDEEAGQRITGFLKKQAPPAAQKELDLHTSFQSIKSAIAKDDHSPATSRSIGTALLKIAATLLLIVGAAFILHHFVLSTPGRTVAEVEQIIKSTEPGQKLTVFLADGSKAILNSASSIEYKATFQQDSIRLIRLTGEAFFDVAHDQSKPFIVEASGVSTTALGTSFNVLARHEDQVEVSLVTGKVAVSGASGRLLLEAGERARYASGVLAKDSFDADRVIAWKEGTLIFQQASLQSVLRDLEMWYGVRIAVSSQPANASTYTGVFSNRSLKEVLDGMAYVYGFDYDMENKNVTIVFH